MAHEFNGPQEPREFDLQDGLSLALSYLEDPSDVPCPHCGPGTIEVVCFLDAPSVETGNAIPTDPEGDYTVVLYCHSCGRAAALDLTRDQQQQDPGDGGAGFDALDLEAPEGDDGFGADDDDDRPAPGDAFGGDGLGDFGSGIDDDPDDEGFRSGPDSSGLDDAA
ncbi:MAG: hypothetical protein ACODAE_09455 [Gemmatimonadota bacterium]